MLSFRQFVEQEAAPPAGMAPPPPSDDDKTKFDSDVMNREFDISGPDAKAAAVDGDMITCFRPLSGLPGQQFLASGPLFIKVRKVYQDGAADVTVMFSMANKNKLKSLDGKTAYDGPVEDLDARLTKADLDRIKLGPFQQMGGIGAPPGGIL